MAEDSPDVKELIKRFTAWSDVANDPKARFYARAQTEFTIKSYRSRVRLLRCADGKTLTVGVCRLAFTLADGVEQVRWQAIWDEEPMTQVRPWRAHDTVINTTIIDVLYENAREEIGYVGYEGTEAS